MIARIGWLAIVVPALAGIAAFVAGHAFGPLVALALLALPAVVALLGMRFGVPLWLPCLLALLPVADLAMWTGQIYLTESDALVLLMVATLGAAMALGYPAPPAKDSPMFFGAGPWALVLLMLASYGMSTDWAPLARLGSDSALLAGYASPLNGVRLAKGFGLAVWLLPVLLATMRAHPQAAPVALGYGMLASLAAVSLAALWERWTFPGLSDFASDYRTVALFWEMNVGGAQLDGWLAACLPFVLWALARERAPARLCAVLAVALLAGYATFTSFSRGLYLGAALGFVTTGLLLARGLPARHGWPRVAGGALMLALIVALLFIMLSGVFQVGGYRGMFATLGLCFVAFLALRHVAAADWMAWLIGGVSAALLGAGGALAALSMPKGVYLLYSMVALGTVVVAARLHASRPARAGCAALIALLGWTAVNAALVNIHWAKPETSTEPAVAASVIVIAVLVALRRRAASLPLADFRGVVVCGAGLAALAVLVVGANTYYAVARMSMVAADLEGREAHWRAAAGLPNPDERWLGIGVGHFAERFLLLAPPEQVPGSHSLIATDGREALQLLAPRHLMGHGAVYRVSQRIGPAGVPPLRVEFVARARGADASVYAEVCRKHLLYPFGCMEGSAAVKASDGWVQGGFTLRGHGADMGRLPEPSVLAIANRHRGTLLEIDRISVVDATGRELVRNGGFASGSDHWFFSSDRHHLPWHAKNLLLHYWVEQGWLGVAAFSCLFLVALARLVAGSAAGHQLAPPLAGALVGLMAVGAFDSLVDAPRFSVLVFSLLFVALGLRRGAGVHR